MGFIQRVIKERREKAKKQVAEIKAKQEAEINTVHEVDLAKYSMIEAKINELDKKLMEGTTLSDEEFQLMITLEILDYVIFISSSNEIM